MSNTYVLLSVASFRGTNVYCQMVFQLFSIYRNPCYLNAFKIGSKLTKHDKMMIIKFQFLLSVSPKLQRILSLIKPCWGSGIRFYLSHGPGYPLDIWHQFKVGLQYMKGEISRPKCIAVTGIFKTVANQVLPALWNPGVLWYREVLKTMANLLSQVSEGGFSCDTSKCLARARRAAKA